MTPDVLNSPQHPACVLRSGDTCEMSRGHKGHLRRNTKRKKKNRLWYHQRQEERVGQDREWAEHTPGLKRLAGVQDWEVSRGPGSSAIPP